MSTLKTAFVLLFSGLFLFSACRKEAPFPEDALTHVPSGVSMVTAIRIPQLMEKADFQSVKTMAFYQEMLRKAGKENPALSSILADPEKAGIDLNKNAYATLEFDTASFQNGFSAVLFSVSDKGALENTLKSLDAQFVPASQSYGYFGEQQTMMVWNDEVLIFGKAGKNADVRGKLEQYLQTGNTASVARDRNLRECLAADYDIANWITSDALSKMFGSELLSGLTRFRPEDLRNNYLQTFVNFEDGKITSKTSFFLKKGLTNDLDLFFKDKVRTDFSKAIPGENLFFMLTAAFDLKGINQILIEKHVKGSAREVLKKYDISMDDLVKALGGDVAVAIYGGDSFLDASLLVSAGIDQKDELDRIIEAAKKADWIEEVSPQHYRFRKHPQEKATQVDSLDAPVAHLEGDILLRDGLIYASDNADLIAQIERGQFATESRPAQTLATLSGRNIFAACLDLLAMRTFDDDLQGVPISSATARADRKSAEGILTFEQPDVNSLKQLFQKLNEAYLESQQKKEKSTEGEI